MIEISKALVGLLKEILKRTYIGLYEFFMKGNSND